MKNDPRSEKNAPVLPDQQEGSHFQQLINR